MLVNLSTIKRLLSLKNDSPLESTKMAKKLVVTFFPSKNISNQLNDFLKNFKTALKSSGVRVVDFEKTLIVKKNRSKIKPGIAIIYVSKDSQGMIPMDYIGSLSDNPIIKILEFSKGLSTKLSYSEKMSLGLDLFTKYMCHLVICINKENWCTYTYNGFSDKENFTNFKSKVLNMIIPKISTRVLPMRLSEFKIIQENTNFVNNSQLKLYVKDLVKGSRLLSHVRLFPKMKDVNEFKYDKPLYRRITSQYLDERTGMSYGYIARQLPVKLTKPYKFKNKNYSRTQVFYDKKKSLNISYTFKNEKWGLKVPEIWVLMSRSGSKKTNLNPISDVLMVGLKNGVFYLKVPKAVDLGSNYRPSFDTRLILAHCLANVIYASIINFHYPSAFRFAKMLESSGSALVHWHGKLDISLIPRGWAVYGQNNPPVLCSSPQSSLYAFIGKEKGIMDTLNSNLDFLGDVHIEPQHGLNIVGPTIKRISHFLFSHSLIN